MWAGVALALAAKRSALEKKAAPKKRIRYKSKETYAERVKRRRPFKPPAGRSPFLELPGELRTMILSLVLTKDRPIHFRSWWLRVKDRRINLNIILVNKQIYFEAYSIWCGTNTFKIEFPDVSRRDLDFLSFLGRIGDFSRCLRHIGIVDVLGYSMFRAYAGRNISPYTLPVIKALRACTHLKSISLPHGLICPYLNPEFLENAQSWVFNELHAVYDVLDHLQATKKSQGSASPANLVITIIAPRKCDSCYAHQYQNCHREQGGVKCEAQCTSLIVHCEELSTKVNKFLSMDRRMVLQQLQERIKGSSFVSDESDEN